MALLKCNIKKAAALFPAGDQFGDKVRLGFVFDVHCKVDAKGIVTRMCQDTDTWLGWSPFYGRK